MMPPTTPPTPLKRLVMTGGTSGFGRRTVERLLAERPEWIVYLLARPSDRSASLVAEAESSGQASRLKLVSCDLASLASVNEALADIGHALEGHSIDALALNAGLQAIASDATSRDGLELSFAVNHLAHFLIAERLAPQFARGGRIVFTASEVHDPEAFCLMGITRATWQPVVELADPVRSQSQLPEGVDRGEARYCASKLLNVMTMRYLSRALAHVDVLAFNPSVVPGTDIARERNVLQILGWKYIMPMLAPILPGARSMHRSAGDLLWLIADADASQLSGRYVDGRNVHPGSAESRDEAKIAEVIAVSRELLATRLTNMPDRDPAAATANNRKQRAAN